MQSVVKAKKPSNIKIAEKLGHPGDRGLNLLKEYRLSQHVFAAKLGEYARRKPYQFVQIEADHQRGTLENNYAEADIFKLTVSEVYELMEPISVRVLISSSISHEEAVKHLKAALRRLKEDATLFQKTVLFDFDDDVPF